MKLWRWLAVALAICGMGVGAAITLEGARFFRDIKQTEALMTGGWMIVAFLSILVTLVHNAVRKRGPARKRRPAR